MIYSKTKTDIGAHMDNRLKPQEEKLCDFSQNENEYANSLHEYVCARFGLENEEENDIGKLAILSIRKQYPDIKKESAAKILGNYDCHRITYAVQKKILMIMEIEKIVGLRIPDDLDDTETISAYIYSSKKAEAEHV